ncbi:MAG TPA: hypothetical protein VMZ92_07965 [Planctomycetota bacterium]|nr:hypothetical protein [Planctomycetota bacterium]
MASQHGADDALRDLRKIRAFAPGEIGRALFQETAVESKECQKVTPVKFGVLRGTIHPEGPFVDGKRIHTAVVAGGPAAPYALVVHEDLEAFHTVGEAKYIERPLKASARHIGSRVAKRIDLNKAL